MFVSQTAFTDASFPSDLNRLMRSTVDHYVACMKDMKGRGMLLTVSISANP